MDKKETDQFKEKLLEEKKRIEGALKKFATKDKNLKGDWDTQFPSWNTESGDASLETSADEVEEYGTLLSIEHSLEEKLKNIDSALEKISEGSYGICEKCKNPVDNERLKVSPEARLCLKCKR